MSGREGKLFHPLAFTKSLALVGVALISVTVVPALIPTFIRGRLRSEEENWIVRSFINIYKPLLTWALPRRNLVMWVFAALLILAAGMFPLQAVLGLGASETATGRSRSSSWSGAGDRLHGRLHPRACAGRLLSPWQAWSCSACGPTTSRRSAWRSCRRWTRARTLDMPITVPRASVTAGGRRPQGAATPCCAASRRSSR